MDVDRVAGSCGDHGIVDFDFVAAAVDCSARHTIDDVLEPITATSDRIAHVYGGTFRILSAGLLSNENSE